MDLKQAAKWLASYDGSELRLMEVCGTHTSALYRSGLRQLLPEKIKMLSGPGCPVCVTPTEYIDKLVEYAMRPGYKVMTFGDMLSVPGSRMSLAEARALGGNADYFYDPYDIIKMAEENPDTVFVPAAVGFETTAPVWALLIEEITQRKINNIKTLTALKTMPAVLDYLCNAGGIDGFLCPGHVAVITGGEYFREFVDNYGETMVIGGFSKEQLLLAMVRLVLESAAKKAGLWNEYREVVTPEGNKAAVELIERYFEPGDTAWRGLGVIEDSGLYLKKEYEYLDAGSFGLNEDKMAKGCRCGEIVLGKAAPPECPFFGTHCTPDHPVGACMVSSEGACRITLREG